MLPAWMILPLGTTWIKSNGIYEICELATMVNECALRDSRCLKDGDNTGPSKLLDHCSSLPSFRLSWQPSHLPKLHHWSSDRSPLIEQKKSTSQLKPYVIFQNINVDFYARRHDENQGKSRWRFNTNVTVRCSSHFARSILDRKVSKTGGAIPILVSLKSSEEGGKLLVGIVKEALAQEAGHLLFACILEFL